jgi:hypothetical protein
LATECFIRFINGQCEQRQNACACHTDRRQQISTMSNLSSELFVGGQITVESMCHKIVCEGQVFVDVFCCPFVEEQVQQTLITAIETANPLSEVQQTIKRFERWTASQYSSIKLCITRPPVFRRLFAAVLKLCFSAKCYRSNFFQQVVVRKCNSSYMSGSILGLVHTELCSRNYFKTDD